MNNPPVQVRNAENTTVFPSLLRGAESILANVSDSFVLLEDMQWTEMKKLVEQYMEEHDAMMRQFFLAPARESMLVGAVTRVINEGRPDRIENLDAPYVLRVETFESQDGLLVPRPGLLKAAVLRSASEEAGVSYKASKYHPWYWGVLGDSYETQRQLLSRVLNDDAVQSMTWAHPRTGFHEVASARVLEIASSSQSTIEFLVRVATPVLAWLGDEFKSNSWGNKRDGIKQPIRPLCLAWFAIWLAERSVWLFPVSVVSRFTEIVPISWPPFRSGLVPIATRPYWADRIESLARLYGPSSFQEGGKVGGRQTALEIVRATLGALRCISTWRSPEQLSMDFFQLGKAVGQGGSSSRGMVLVKLWDATKGSLDLEPTQLQAEEAKLRPRKKRTRGQLGRAWSWVDDPDYQPRTIEKYYVAGFHAGENLLNHLRELRSILPKLAGKAVTNWTMPLNLWLMYLASLPDASVPPSILAIDRVRHIDDPHSSTSATLSKFLPHLGLPPDNVTHAGVYSQLAATWDAAYTLAAPDQRPAQRICPVLPKFDAPKLKNANKGRTHRRPLDEEVLLFIIEANRKNDFEFSRTRLTKPSGGRLVDARLVRDPESGEMRYEWYPGLAVLIDVLFNIPLRKKQARYLDSGEGDEQALDIETLQLRPNRLATAAIGRNQSFFKLHTTSLLENKAVLGMWVNTSKTGKPYAVPWLPVDVARNCQLLIDWQLRYNPISAPVRDRDYKSNTEVIEDRFSEPVYPIFRDPSVPTHEPIGDGVLQAYFEALLSHCEREFNRQTGRNVSFFREEMQTKGLGKGTVKRKPIIDLHSLRVTGVTILIENGVPIEIVQLLVGHATVAMTIYYHVLDQRKVHEEMMRWMESRAPKLQRLQAMSPEELGRLTDRFLKNMSSDSSLGRAQFLDLVIQRNPGWDYRYHGICAGGDCKFGGPPEKEGGDGTPLWRESACSLCRYRVTGAPWLVGLVHHVNQLWWELRQVGSEVMELQLRRDALEDAGEPLKSILGDMERAKIKRDHLFEEWVAEVNYVNQAQADLDDWIAYCDSQESIEGGSMPGTPALRSPLGPDGVKTQLGMVHELSQLTELVRGARVLESVVLPRGILEDRNAILLEIARASGLDGAFLRLRKDDAKRALDLFADLVLDSVGAGQEEVQALVDGQRTLRDVPELEQKVLELLPGAAEVRRLFARRSARADGESE